MEVLRGEKLIERLDERLSKFAVKNAAALCGATRSHEEKAIPCDTRTPFQHDRDRIIYSRAFRRLRGKTQVFVATRGDHYRTRLSHTLEVAQMARSVARVFQLNEDLTEAIALGHDLGHAPFGHSGERVLHIILSGQKPDICALDVGGFKHNINSLKAVDFFERYHPDFPGLNLTHWTREGILKHTGTTVEGYGKVWDEVIDLNGVHPECDAPTFLEGQIVAICDEIAQVTHDLEDAFRDGILQVEDDELSEVPIYATAKAEAAHSFDDLNKRTRVIRNLIGILVTALIEGTNHKLTAQVGTSEPFFPVRNWVVAFDKDMEVQVTRLKNILLQAVYTSYVVSRMDVKGERIISHLFKAYFDKPQRLPEYLYRKYNDAIASFVTRGPGFKELRRSDLEGRTEELQRDKVFVHMIAEHIAGMTDSFAMHEYNELFIPTD